MVPIIFREISWFFNRMVDVEGQVLGKQQAYMETSLVKCLIQLQVDSS